jgi:translocation and assembly module TamB
MRRISLLLLGLVVALTWFEPRRVVAQAGSGTVSDLLSWALSTPTTQLSIGGVDGVLSSDVTIRDVTVSDRDGVWLRLDRARLVWSRTALFSRRLQIDQLDVGHVTMLRRPVPSDPDAVAEAPSLPELPVKVVVGGFRLAELDLGEPVFGTPARLAARGSASLGPPAEGLKLDFSAERLDAAARFLVRLAYVPATTDLQLDVDLDEAAGGLVSHALAIPGFPPVRLAVKGAGRLDDWAGRISFAASADIGAEGQARLQRAGSGRELSLGLTARIAGLLPPGIGPVFAGTTTLDGAVAFADDGAVTIRRLDLVAQAARVTLRGGIDASRNADLQLEAAAVPTEGGRTRAGAAEIERLALKATLTGPLVAPRLQGRFDAAGLRVPAFSLATLSGHLDVAPIEKPAGAERFALGFDAMLDGLALSDAALGRAIGPSIHAVGRGTIDSGAVANLAELGVTTPTGDAQFVGRIGYRMIAGRSTLTIPSLAPLSDLAGTPLAGALDANADLTGDPGRSRLSAAIDARTTGLSTGVDRLDSLLGPRVTATGEVTRLALGFAFKAFTVRGAHLDASLDGVATRDAAALNGILSLPDLGRLDPRLSGRGDVTAALSGSLARPDLDAKAVIRDARMMGRPVQALTVSLQARDLSGDVAAKVTLSGEVDRKPAEGRLSFARGGETWRLDHLDLRVGSVSATGALAIDPAGLAAGSLKLAAGQLDDIAPLLLTRVSGSATASVDLSVADGGQNAQVAARASTVRFGDVGVGDLSAQLSLGDLHRRPTIDGRVQAKSIAAFGQTFDTADLVARGTPAASDLELSARGGGFDLRGSGRLVPGAPTRLDLSRLEARRNGHKIDLAQPARLTWAEWTLGISNLSLRVDGGRLDIAGQVGRSLDLKIDARAVPLSAAEIIAPGVGLGGTLDGSATLAGSPSAPSGRYRLSAKGLTFGAARAAGVAPAGLTATGSLAQGRVGVDATLTMPGSGALTVSGSLPVDPAGRLDLTVRGPLDLSVLSAPLGARGQSLRGKLALDVALRGSVDRPELAGSATLSGGFFADYLRGVQVNGLSGRFVARGDSIAVEQITGTTPNGGSVQADGRVTLDLPGGLPAELRLRGQRAQIVSDGAVLLVADVATTVTGPLLRAPRLAGSVDIVSLDIDLGDIRGPTRSPLPDTRHVQPPPQARALLALERRDRGRRAAPPITIGLDLALRSADTIAVRGRGVVATLGGGLRLTGTSAAPIPTGSFVLNQGALTLPGRRIDLVRGTVLFGGSLEPTIDFLAETQADGITARVEVSGPADKPEFTISSIPELPQDEVLSRVLFGKTAGGLNGFQALQLAQTAAILSGGGGGVGGFDALRRSLGADSLDVSADQSGGPALGLSRALSRNIRIGVQAGAKTESSGVRVDLGVGRGIRLQGTVGPAGSSVGVGTEWEY